MADDVWAWCETHQVFGQTVTVKIKFSDFRHITRSRTLASPVATAEQLHEVCIALARSVYPVQLGVRLVGVSISKLCAKAPYQQLELSLA